MSVCCQKFMARFGQDVEIFILSTISIDKTDNQGQI